MTSRGVRSTVARPVSRSTVRRRRYPGVAALALVNAVAAVGGAWGLGSGALSLGAEVEARLPWGNTTVGAAALTVLRSHPGHSSG